MFEKLMQKFSKRQPKEEKIEFKKVDEIAEELQKPRVQELAAPETPSKADKHAESVELRVMRPESYDEVGTVADHLLDGCTVVLNVEVLDKGTIVRMLDFLNGVTYCTDGEIKRVAQTTFIITPHTGVDISDM